MLILTWPCLWIFPFTLHVSFSSDLFKKSVLTLISSIFILFLYSCRVSLFTLISLIYLKYIFTYVRRDLIFPKMMNSFVILELIVNSISFHWSIVFILVPNIHCFNYYDIVSFLYLFDFDIFKLFHTLTGTIVLHHKA